MNRSIKLLDDNTINKIAAGEVVERPSSVIKELLENSIDASSTSITVEIEDGGKTSIRVTDNGVGINRDDIELAFLRHSTSKISKAEDLSYVETLGFRGEALASISAVSQIELITKTSEDNSGIKTIINGGILRSQSEVGCPDGTTIIVKNLFYNTPVRQKFLKTNNTESTHIGDIVYRLAISNPGISFNYIRDKKSILKTPGRGNLETTVYSVLGKDFIEGSFDISSSCDGMELYGFIGKPTYTRSNRSSQYLFINGRYIKDNDISKVVERAYSTLITTKRFPTFLLFINVDSRKIDVNVHPTKTEVRFTSRKLLNQFITNSIKSVLQSEDLIPKVNFLDDSNSEKISKQALDNKEKQVILDALDTSDTSSTPSIYDRIKKDKTVENNNIDSLKVIDFSEVDSNTLDKLKNIDDVILGKCKSYDINDKTKDKTETIDTKTVKTTQEVDKIDNSQIKSLLSDINIEKEKKNQNNENINESACLIYDKDPIERVPEIVVVGNLFKTYILGQDVDNKVFYMIDQHAAHERIMYERLKEQFLSQGVSTQMLIATDILELSLHDIELVKNNLDMFSDLGFEIEDFGTNTIALRGVPLVFGKPNSKKLFLDILDNLDNSPISNYELQIDKIMKLACTSAIKANDTLEDIEMDKLIEDLRNTKEPFTCPHGRPVIIEMTKSELEKKFKRT